MYNKIKNYLENEPRARERRLHHRAMVNLLLDKYPELKMIEKNMLVDFAKDFESHVRVWRKVVEENEHLRGEDYKDRDMLEQQKMLDLGYEVGFYQDKISSL